MTFKTLIQRAVDDCPEKVFASFRRNDGWHQETFREFDIRVKSTAQYAADRLGLAPREDKAAIWLENDVRWTEFYAAMAVSAVTVVPMDPKFQAEEVAYVLDNSETTLIFTDRRHLTILERILPDLPKIRAVILDEPAGVDSVAGVPIHAFEEMAAYQTKEFPFCAGVEPKERDIASIIYTSGTTGKPKGAMLTHANFIADAVGCLDHIPQFGAKDSFIVILPLFHSFAFTVCYVVPLVCHASLAFGESLRTIGEDIRKAKPTVLIAVPLLADKLYQKIEAGIKASHLARLLCAVGLGKVVGRKVRQQLGGKLDLIIIGGAPCPPRVLRGFNRLGINATEGYGLTEAAPVVTVAQFHRQRIGTIGTRLPNVEIRLANEDASGVGELQVRGPTVMLGYYKNEAATRETFDGEWLRTGDLASIDKDGYVSIRGRSKALIVNREGKNIYPEEVENVLSADAHIGDIIVLGYHAGKEPGERIGAIVHPNLDLFKEENGGVEPPFDQVERTIETIIRERCSALADYKHPRKILISAEPLERTSTQKVRRCTYKGALDTP
ncbi:MAG: AMP-dependent synthetase/ligase [Kiritimatiellia bacterium]